jgi:hypothetical protein
MAGALTMPAAFVHFDHFPFSHISPRFSSVENSLKHITIIMGHRVHIFLRNMR